MSLFILINTATIILVSKVKVNFKEDVIFFFKSLQSLDVHSTFVL